MEAEEFKEETGRQQEQRQPSVGKMETKIKKRKKINAFTLSFINEELNEQFKREKLPTKKLLLSIVFAFQALINVLYIIQLSLYTQDKTEKGKIQDNDLFQAQKTVFLIFSGVFSFLLFWNLLCFPQEEISQNNSSNSENLNPHNNRPGNKLSSGDTILNSNNTNNGQPVTNGTIQNSSNVVSNSSNFTSVKNNSNFSYNKVGKTQYLSIKARVDQMKSWISKYLSLICFLTLIVQEIVIGISSRLNQGWRHTDIALVQVFISMTSLDSWIQQCILSVLTISLQWNSFEHSMTFFAVLPSFLGVLYSLERRKKLVFYNYFYLQKTLAAQQKLFDHTLPCSVIVLSSNDQLESQYNFTNLKNISTFNDSGGFNRKNSFFTKKSVVSQYTKQPQQSLMSIYHRQNSVKQLSIKPKQTTFVKQFTVQEKPTHLGQLDKVLKQNTLNLNDKQFPVPQQQLQSQEKLVVFPNQHFIRKEFNLREKEDNDRNVLRDAPLAKSVVVSDQKEIVMPIKSTLLDPKDNNYRESHITLTASNPNSQALSNSQEPRSIGIIPPPPLPQSNYQDQNQYTNNSHNMINNNINNNNHSLNVIEDKNKKCLGTSLSCQMNYSKNKQDNLQILDQNQSPSFPEQSTLIINEPPSNEHNCNQGNTQKQSLNLNSLQENGEGGGNNIANLAMQNHLFQQHLPLPSNNQISTNVFPPQIDVENQSNLKLYLQSNMMNTQTQIPSFLSLGVPNNILQGQQGNNWNIATQSMGNSSMKNELPLPGNTQVNPEEKKINLRDKPYFDAVSRSLKVNFVNSTCLHSFSIQREETKRRSRPYEDPLKTEFFNEAQPLQDEVFTLLSQIEVKTNELDLPLKSQNNCSQLNNITINSPIEPSESSSRNLPKKKLISASLLDVVCQKYSLFHKKYIQQISKEVNDSITKPTLKHKAELSFEEVYKQLDLEKEDVFVNCVYKSGQTEKVLDIHIIEFQWIDEPAIMVVMTDVSQKVRAKRLKDLDSYKNELLATVTHDLKTPLNGMLSILEVALDLTNIQEIKNFIQIVQKNGTLLNYLIMDILDYSAMLKGELRLIISRFDINDVLKDIADLIGFQAQQKKLQFNIYNNLSYSDCFFDNDQRRIKQILLNLTSNALKFTFKGEISVTLTADSDYNNSIKITVKDTGVGIPDSLQPKLFKLYGTFDHNNGSNKHGVGLGLVITKKLASQVGPKDSLKLESVEKVGTSFTFSLYKSFKNQQHNMTNNDSRTHPYDSPTNNFYNNSFNSKQKINSNQLYQVKNPNNFNDFQDNIITDKTEDISIGKTPIALDTFSNTQEHMETDGPLLSQKGIHLHTATPFFLGGKGQIQKLSQFQQYQSNSVDKNSFEQTAPSGQIEEKQSSSNAHIKTEDKLLTDRLNSFDNITTPNFPRSKFIDQNNHFKDQPNFFKKEAFQFSEENIESNKNICDAGTFKRFNYHPGNNTNQIFPEYNQQQDQNDNTDNTSINQHTNITNNNKNNTIIQQNKLNYQGNFQSNQHSLAHSRKNTNPNIWNQERELETNHPLQGNYITSENGESNYEVQSEEPSAIPPRQHIISPQNEEADYPHKNIQAQDQFMPKPPNVPLVFSMNSIHKSNSLKFTRKNLEETPLRILIVDDTYFNIIALKLLLKQFKNSIIDEAYNGQQAIEVLTKYKENQLQLPEGERDNSLHLIFMDINMPIMDGLECTRLIRQDSFFEEAKIVAVTAYSSASEGQKCFDAGMDAHLCKPISKLDCYTILTDLLEYE